MTVGLYIFYILYMLFLHCIIIIEYVVIINFIVIHVYCIYVFLRHVLVTKLKERMIAQLFTHPTSNVEICGLISHPLATISINQVQVIVI